MCPFEKKIYYKANPNIQLETFGHFWKHMCPFEKKKIN
jgi:hypothetical protein